MGYAARTHGAAATRDYHTRRLAECVNFAKGVLIGGIAAVSLWLLLG